MARTTRKGPAGLLILGLLALGACGDEGDPTGAPSGDPTADAGGGASDGGAGGDVADPDGDARPDDDAAPGGDAGGDGTDEPACESDEAFFEEQVWARVVGPVCSVCHRVDGLAAASNFTMEPSVRPDYLEVNRERLGDLARVERDGVSTLLLKPRGEMNHGGGVVLREGTEGYAILEAFIERLDAPVTCPPVDRAHAWEGVTLEAPERTLRRASLLLASRLPTDDERERVRTGGEEALRDVLDELLDSEAFVERMGEIWQDRLWTERYNRGTRALNLLDAETYPDRYWYEALEDESLRNRMASRTNEAIARQPIELVKHLVRTRRPFTEILTADYVMLNEFSARSFGVSSTLPDIDDPASTAFRPVRVESMPVAGVLTTPAYLNRFPSTPTNRNRHRARIFFDRFLATDILALADRPIDPTEGAYHNPTLNDPDCTICHAMMDPVAGLFQNWDDAGRRRIPEQGWYPDMLTPGYGEATLPSAERTEAIRWLAEQTVEDPRFALAVVQTVFEGVMGRAPVRTVDPADTEASDLQRRTYRLERETFLAVARVFEAEGWDVRTVVRELVLSPFFRAEHAEASASPEAAAAAGRERLLSPEDLNRRVTAITGYPWRTSRTNNDLLLDRYRMLYGGLDWESVVTRLEDPNGIMRAIQERLALQHACRVVPRDFTLRADDRRLFPHVEASFVPQTPEGFEIPDALAAIRANARHLHAHILGEDLALDDPEIDATVALFRTLWEQGQDARASGDAGRDLPWSCQSREDFFTGEPLPEERRIQRDDNYTLRAWIGVVSYLMSDYRFLYE